MLKRITAAMALVLLLSSCILVKDFSPLWDSSKPDMCTSKIAESLYYSEFQRDPDGKDMDDYAHIFDLGKYHFLMLKKDTADKGGRMYRFGVVNGIFQRYRLDPSKRKAFDISHPNAPVSFRNDTVTLDSLSEREIALLKKISDTPEYWEIEDQAMYNTLASTLCRFDDRDLKELSDKKKNSSHH